MISEKMHTKTEITLAADTLLPAFFVTVKNSSLSTHWYLGSLEFALYDVCSDGEVACLLCNGSIYMYCTNAIALWGSVLLCILSPHFWKLLLIYAEYLVLR